MAQSVVQSSQQTNKTWCATHPTARDVLAGTTAGIVAKTTTHPLDTIKVRLQSAMGSGGIGECLRGIVKTDGIRGFYRGVSAPILSSSLENAFLFGAYSNGVNLWCELTGSGGKTKTERLKNTPLHAVFVGGAVGGIATAHILTPIELIKCRLQVPNHYTGLFDCLRQTLKNEGIRTLFRGHVPMLAREIPGNGAWFVSYELSKAAMVPAGKTKEDLTRTQVACAGGFAGVMYWTAFFPADVVKTRMQTTACTGVKQTIGSCLRDIYRVEGLGGLYRGWGITCLRAFPMNAAIFTTYNLVIEAWDKTFYGTH